jgi:hypothetical protein
MSDAQEILRRKFTTGQCETRKGPGGFTLTYVAHFAVIDRLIEAVGIGNFQWTISSVVVADNMVTVQGDLTLWLGERWVTNSGVSTEALKGDLEKCTKTADTDAMKRAARLFGVGLHLYDKHDDAKPAARPAARPAAKKRSTGGAASGPTEKQRNYLKVLAKNQGLSNEEFASRIELIKGKSIKSMSVAEVSELIDWVKEADLGQAVQETLDRENHAGGHDDSGRF